MSHLQNYAEQLGGFDFSLSQRYGFLTQKQTPRRKESF